MHIKSFKDSIRLKIDQDQTGSHDFYYQFKV